MTRRNKSHLATALLCSTLLFLSAASVAGAQSSVNVHAFPPGARAYGMGGAFVAVADDASALYWNPAGLVDSRFSLMGSAGVQELGKFAELEGLFGGGDDWDGQEDLGQGSLDQSLSMAALVALSVGPVGLGALGEGWMDVALQEQEVQAVDEAGELVEQDGEPLLDESFPAGTADMSLLIGARAGLGLRVLNLGPVGSLALGAAGNYYVGGTRMSFEFEPEEKVVIETSGESPVVPVDGVKVYEARESEFSQVDGYSIDLGLKARLTPWITVGAVAHDVVHTLTWSGDQTTITGTLKETEPGSGEYKVVKEENPASETVTADRSMRYQVGVAVTPPLLGLTLAADLDSEKVVHLGAEWRTLFGILALRAGYLTPLSGGEELPAGYGAPVRVGAGLGLPFLHLNAGVGFKSMDELSTVQDAMVELSLRF